MQRWIAMSALLLALPAAAEIYKCRDAQGRISYQGTPCAVTTLGTVKAPPPVSEEAQQRAQERLQRMQEAIRARDVAREKEWQQRQEEARRQAEEEARARQQAERERLEQERRARYYWYPWLPRWPWWGAKPAHPPHQHPPSRHPPHAGGEPPPGKRNCTTNLAGVTTCE